MRIADQEEARLVTANRFLILHSAAWDVIMTDAKKIVYLDCNPGPYLMWIGPEFRQAVFLQLARYLVAFARSGRLEEASERVERWRPS